ncbi:MAG TPA: hypothetical protein VF708_19975 [Pyrinomonadaceae bacterium]|jgi:hypothetical protein
MIPLTEIRAVEFNVRRELFLGRSAKLVLLREDQSADRYKTLRVISADWDIPKPNEFFGTQSFYVADISQPFADLVHVTTHVVVVGSDLSPLNGQLFELTPETSAPTGEHAYWNLRCKSISKRFTPDLEP